MKQMTAFVKCEGNVFVVTMNLRAKTKKIISIWRFLWYQLKENYPFETN